MLSLKEVEKVAKARGLSLAIEGNYRYQLTKPIELDEKKYEKWKEKRLVYWKKYDEEQIAYYNKYYKDTSVKYHPISGGPQIKEAALRKAYETELKYSHNFQGLELTQGTSIYSCAINEFGEFTLGGKLQKHWKLLLTYYINQTKYHYLKCATPVKPAYKELRAALKKLGFEKRAKELSNHGKYYVEVWEFIKPQEKKAKKKEK